MVNTPDVTLVVAKTVPPFAVGIIDQGVKKRDLLKFDGVFIA
jgi:hypothetical protein